MTKKPMCCHCNKTRELRPYGPGGALVCFDCAFSTPEREQETKAQYGGMLEEAGSVAELTDIGPLPRVKHGRA